MKKELLEEIAKMMEKDHLESLHESWCKGYMAGVDSTNLKRTKEMLALNQSSRRIVYFDTTTDAEKVQLLFDLIYSACIGHTGSIDDPQVQA